ncbi:MAG: histidine kinase dimerization/phosphoacceptor domain -containing protein [Pseudomonadota bacterium]
MALLVAILLLPAGAIAIHAGLSAAGARHQTVQGEEGARIYQSLGLVRDQISQIREMARSLAANSELMSRGARACENGLNQFAVELRRNASITLVGEEGEVWCSNGASTFFAKGEVLGLVHSAEDSNDVVVGFLPGAAPLSFVAAVAPMARPAGTVEGGFVVITLPAQGLLGEALSVARQNEGYALLVDRGGEILASAHPPSELNSAGVREQIRAHAPNALEQAFLAGEHWAVGVPLERGRLYLVVGWLPVAVTWSEAASAVWALLAPIFLWWGGIAAAWYAVDMFVARPLVAIERLAKGYMDGAEVALDDRDLINAPVEIESLRRTLVTMHETLRGREARLADALSEERALLREVNHRVKNNLQLVASLLSIQVRASADQDEARGLLRAQERVQVLALAHTRIYESGRVREVALDLLTEDIVRTLMAAKRATTDKAERPAANVQMDLEPVRVSVDRAVSYAFLIGEALLLAVDTERGERDAPAGPLAIALKKANDTEITLEIGGLGALGSAFAASRMIEAFARQMNAVVQCDENSFRLMWSEDSSLEA